MPVAASHSRAVLSSLAASGRVLPSGLKATAQTAPSCPVRAGRWACRWPRPTAAPSVVRCRSRQRLAVGAEGHGNGRRPRAPWASPMGRAGGRVPQPRRLVPARRSGRVLPSGLKATARTAALVRRGARPGAAPVAASHSRAVSSALAGQDGLAVGAEGHGTDPALVPHGRRRMGLPVGGVPQPRRPVLARRSGASCRRG